MGFFESFISGIIGSLPSMMVTVLATLAITLIFKTSYTTNFAQGTIAGVGSYVTMQLFVTRGVPIALGMLVGVAVGTLIGLFVDIVIFRNGRNVNAIGKQIITMGVLSLIVAVVPFIFSVARLESTTLIPFVSATEYYSLSENITIQKNTVICIAITVFIVAVIFILLNKSKWGLGVRATASNEFVAGMLGINTRVITAVSWAIAGAIGAISATMYAGIAQLNTVLFMTTIQVNAFLACILGGLATFYGPIFGAVLISVLSAVIGFVISFVPSLSTWREVIVYVILLLLVLWKPQGLFGPRAVKKV